MLWNTVYLERATRALDNPQAVDVDLLRHLSPLGWEHINLTGDYTWKSTTRTQTGPHGTPQILNILCDPFSAVTRLDATYSQSVGTHGDCLLV